MKTKLILLYCFLIALCAQAQIQEGQFFCDATPNGSYFPLELKTKIIFWAETHYIETRKERKVFNGKTYIAFEQLWEGNTTPDVVYLRTEKGVTYQYEECCEKETIRYDSAFKEGHSWKTADGETSYTILSYNGTLKTPFCEYTNLMVIEAQLKTNAFKFYYHKGHGYIGATVDDQIISCLSPVLPE